MRHFINPDPRQLRARAEVARTVGDTLADSECKRMMLQVAEDYDELAQRAEERARTARFRSPLAAARSH